MIVYLGHTAHINGNENLKIDFNSMDLNNDSDILFQCLMLTDHLTREMKCVFLRNLFHCMNSGVLKWSKKKKLKTKR